MEETWQGGLPGEWELRLEFSGIDRGGRQAPGKMDTGMGWERGLSSPFYRQQTEAEGGMSLLAS